MERLTYCICCTYGDETSTLCCFKKKYVRQRLTVFRPEMSCHLSHTIFTAETVRRGGKSRIFNHEIARTRKPLFYVLLRIARAIFFLLLLTCQRSHLNRSCRYHLSYHRCNATRSKNIVVLRQSSTAATALRSWRSPSNVLGHKNISTAILGNRCKIFGNDQSRTSIVKESYSRLPDHRFYSQKLRFVL